MNVETKYLPATELKGERVKVIDLTTGDYKLVSWNYRDSQRNNHDNAVNELMGGACIVHKATSTETGFIYEVERVGK